jgi:hypothetical protein
MILKRNKWIYYVLIYLALFSYHLVISKYKGDDFYFSSASVNHHLIPWLNERYHTWSGRLFPDAMAFILLGNWLWVWRIINPIFIIVLAYGLVRIWKKRVGVVDLLSSLVILGYFRESVLSSGFFWITGSMNYLWPVTLGLLAMIPYADFLFRDVSLSNKYLYILSIISGFLASIGNEQAALCMSCFAILFHFEVIRQKRSQEKILILQTVMIIAGTCILLFAPGSQIRWVKEVAYWFPGFDRLSLKDHLYLGTIWGFQKLFFDMKNLVLLLSAFAIVLSRKDQKMRKSIVFKLFTFLFLVILLLHVNSLGLGQLYGFTEIKNFRFTSALISSVLLQKHFILALFPYVFWSIYSCILVYLIIKNSRNRLFGLFTFLATLATLVVMFFSPTIYASGSRVLTVGSVLLALVLIGRIVENKLITSIFPLCILGCYPLINLLHILYMWHVNGFTPFL